MCGRHIGWYQKENNCESQRMIVCFTLVKDTFYLFVFEKKENLLKKNILNLIDSSF